VNSLDTNLLLAALDETGSRHREARELLLRMYVERNAWVLADQTLFELYRALRNAKVVERPLSAAEALSAVEDIRIRSQAAHVAYETRLWPRVLDLLRRQPERKGSMVFDVCLAVTLHAHGVERLYTRNVADFRLFGLFEVVDPLA